MTITAAGPGTGQDGPQDRGAPAALPDGRAGESGVLAATGRVHTWVKHAPAERAPALVIPGIWVGAEICHLAGLPPLVAGAGTVAAAGLAFGLGERRQHHQDKDVEPGQDESTAGIPGDAAALPAAYRKSRIRGLPLALATLGTGAWVTLADIWGVTGGPEHLAGLLYLGGAVGGYCWLRTHETVRAARRKREADAAAAAEAAARAQQWESKKAAWRALAARIGIPKAQNSFLLSWEKTPLGESWLVNTTGTGVRASSLAGRDYAERIAELGGRLDGSGWALPPGRVDMRLGPVAGQLRITVRDVTDPWAKPTMHPMASGEMDPSAPYAGLVTMSPSSRDPVVIGVDPETGRPMALPFRESPGARHIMVCGATGSGKTMIIDTCRVQFAMAPDVVFFQINLSKPRGDRPWTGVAEGSALKGDPDADARALAILDYLCGVIGIRGQGASTSRMHQPTAAEPHYVVIIDELVSCVEDPGRRERVQTIARTGRENAVSLLLAGQRPVQTEAGGTTVRANTSFYVYGAMISSDRSRGSDNMGLPDMGAYGEGAPGVFGIARMNAGESALIAQGRAFFWGDDSPGLSHLIGQLTAAHRQHTPEPVIAADPALMKLWEAATGGQMPDGDRYDLTATRDGHTVQGVTNVLARLDQARQVVNSPGPGASAEDRQDDTEGVSPRPLPEEQQEQLWQLSIRPEGVSTREAAAQMGYNHVRVNDQFRIWRADGRAEVRGEGGGRRWHGIARTRLHVVPDQPAAEVPRPPSPETAVSVSEAHEPDRVYVPWKMPVTRSDMVTAAAVWGLAYGSPGQGADLSAAAEHARERGLPEDVVTEAVALLHGHLPYVVSKALRTSRQAGTAPPWIARWAPLVEPDPGTDGDPDEDELDEDPDEDDADSGEPAGDPSDGGRSVAP